MDRLKFTKCHKKNVFEFTIEGDCNDADYMQHTGCIWENEEDISIQLDVIEKVYKKQIGMYESIWEIDELTEEEKEVAVNNDLLPWPEHGIQHLEVIDFVYWDNDGVLHDVTFK